MGEPRTVRPVLPLLVLFSRHSEALDWARSRAEARWGRVCLESPRFHFDQTDYYHATMGGDLSKQLLAFEPLMDPAELAGRKQQSNAWEAECAAAGQWPERRPLNLDPGYLTEAKLVLASTKDREHRIYQSGGIYAEVTLYYRQGAWRPWPWTYPDFAAPAYHAFLDEARQVLRARYRSELTS